MPTVINTPVRLMPYEYWMTNTAVKLRARSQVLRELDDPLLVYERTAHPKALAAIRQKLKEWQDSQLSQGLRVRLLVR